MASALADIFREAALLTGQDPGRKGNVVSLGAGLEVIVAGDLHGHRANLAKIIAYADLAHHPHRRLVLQEIIHGPPDARTGQDRSVDPLLRACRLKVAHPQQVIFLLGNHDVAQLTGDEITKGGRGVCESFTESLRQAAGDGDAADLVAAVNEFLLSMPLAVRCHGGALVCHTLPTPDRMALSGLDIPAEPYRPEDLRRGGRVYEWTWGRQQTPEQIDRLADHLKVTFFVLAHKRIESAYELLSPKAIILTAEHEHGAILEFPSDLQLAEATVVRNLKPIVALGAPTAVSPP
jgi:hypothetical protein